MGEVEKYPRATERRIKTIHSILKLTEPPPTEPIGYHTLSINALDYWIEHHVLPGTEVGSSIAPQGALFFVPIASAFEEDPPEYEALTNDQAFVRAKNMGISFARLNSLRNILSVSRYSKLGLSVSLLNAMLGQLGRDPRNQGIHDEIEEARRIILASGISSEELDEAIELSSHARGFVLGIHPRSKETHVISPDPLIASYKYMESSVGFTDVDFTHLLACGPDEEAYLDELRAEGKL